MSGCVVKQASSGYEFHVPTQRVRRRSSLWLPTSESGLVHWFRADRGVTFAAGTKVSLWANGGDGGGDLAQASSSAQFTWNPTGLGGKPSLVGDGSLTLMQGTSPSTLTARTYGFVYSATRATQNRIFDSLSTTYPLLGLMFDGTRTLYMSSATNYRYFSADARYFDGLMHAMVITVPGVALNDISGATMEIDGQSIAASTTSTAGAAVQTPGGLVLGGSGGGGIRFGGHIGEFVVYNRVLALDKRQQLAAYLLAR